NACATSGDWPRTRPREIHPRQRRRLSRPGYVRADEFEGRLYRCGSPLEGDATTGRGSQPPDVNILTGYSTPGRRLGFAGLPDGYLPPGCRRRAAGRGRTGRAYRASALGYLLWLTQSEQWIRV